MSWLNKKIIVPSKIRLPSPKEIGKQLSRVSKTFHKKPKHKPIIKPTAAAPAAIGTPLPIVHRRIVRPSSAYGGYTGVCISGSLSGYNSAISSAYGPLNERIYVEDDNGEIISWEGPPWLIESPPQIHARLGDTPEKIHRRINLYLKDYREWCDNLSTVAENAATEHLDKLEELSFNDFYDCDFIEYGDTNSNVPR